jgi:hypothetical protein
VTTTETDPFAPHVQNRFELDTIEQLDELEHELDAVLSAIHYTFGPLDDGGQEVVKRIATARMNFGKGFVDARLALSLPANGKG